MRSSRRRVLCPGTGPTYPFDINIDFYCRSDYQFSTTVIDHCPPPPRSVDEMCRQGTRRQSSSRGGPFTPGHLSVVRSQQKGMKNTRICLVQSKCGAGEGDHPADRVVITISSVWIYKLLLIGTTHNNSLSPTDRLQFNFDHFDGYLL